MRIGETEVDTEVDRRMSFGNYSLTLENTLRCLAWGSPWVWLKSPDVMRLADGEGIISMASALWRIGPYGTVIEEVGREMQCV